MICQSCLLEDEEEMEFFCLNLFSQMVFLTRLYYFSAAIRTVVPLVRDSQQLHSWDSVCPCVCLWMMCLWNVLLPSFPQELKTSVKCPTETALISILCSLFLTFYVNVGSNIYVHYCTISNPKNVTISRYTYTLYLKIFVIISRLGLIIDQ